MTAYLYPFLTAIFICILLGPIFIPVLRTLKFGQIVRDDGPVAHLKKSGTPTMGGIIFIIAIIISTLLFAEKSKEIIISLIVFVGFGLIGFADDFIKVVLHRSLGLKARSKLLWQILFGFFLGFAAVWYLGIGTDIKIPVLNIYFDLKELYPIFTLIVVVAATNAVNLTDGLDGLASSITFCSALAYAFICYILGAHNLLIFALAVAGGCLGFLFYNKYPAKIFMGDTGSLALGAALAVLAVLTKTELILLIIGGVYVLETLSVIIQVISFKLTGKRIFKMSPIHHHFELLGWKETKVVSVFFIVAVLFALLGMKLFL